MSKHEMIAMIRQRNRSASEQFLTHFEDRALDDYLRRLQLREQRGRETAWVRTGPSPAVVMRAK
mgnify:CR=1 FL=1